jgi:hypothetical protein
MGDAFALEVWASSVVLRVVQKQAAQGRSGMNCDSEIIVESINFCLFSSRREKKKLLNICYIGMAG